MISTLRVTTIAVALTSAVTLAASPQSARKPTLIISPTNPQSSTNNSRWKVLFDGTSLDAWRGYKSDAVPDGWRIEKGTLTKDRPVKDLVSKDEFGDFELEIEWKIGEAGNSGIFYRGSEEFEHIYWSAPEYQLLDDIKASDNKTRIVAKGAHVEHWLNDFKLLEYEFWSPDRKAKVKASKFGEWPGYGRATKGHFALQGDHNGVLSFRNIRVRELR